jgi:hypothetical protein
MTPMTEYLLASEAMTGLCTEFLMSADRVFGLVLAAIQPGSRRQMLEPAERQRPRGVSFSGRMLPGDRLTRKRSLS